MTPDMNVIKKDIRKLAIIASKGSLDMAYPPFILASTAAALGYDVQVFFTFYGLQLLRKDLSDVMISPLANPAMPMPVPMPVRPAWCMPGALRPSGAGPPRRTGVRHGRRGPHGQAARARNASCAACTVAAMSSAVCAALTKPASYKAGAR